MDRFQKTLQDAVNRDLAEFDRQIDMNDKRVIWEIIVGVVFIALSIMLTIYLDKLLLTIVSVFGTMAVRDAIQLKTTINHNIKHLKRQLDPIGDIKLEVVQQS
ncbi:MAG: hypothetical protein IKF07_06305 [Eubacterium sp.]|nr:hypothetical protein [Eubacterium sp.]